MGLIVGASYVTEEDPVCRTEYDTVAFYEQHCQTTFLKRPANKFLGRTASRFPRRAARKETCRTGQIFTNTATLILEFQGFGIEFMITLVLVMVIFASASDANNKDLCERLCSSCHRPFHHHLPPLRHPPHRLHHEPSTQPGAQLGDGVLGQPLGVLGLSYPSWDKCWFSLPAGVPGELLGQVGGQRYHTIINTSTSLNFLFQAAPSHTDKGWTRRRWRTYCRTSWSS